MGHDSSLYSVVHISISVLVLWRRGVEMSEELSDISATSPWLPPGLPWLTRLDRQLCPGQGSMSNLPRPRDDS